MLGYVLWLFISVVSFYAGALAELGEADLGGAETLAVPGLGNVAVDALEGSAWGVVDDDDVYAALALDPESEVGVLFGCFWNDAADPWPEPNVILEGVAAAEGRQGDVEVAMLTVDGRSSWKGELLIAQVRGEQASLLAQDTETVLSLRDALWAAMERSGAVMLEAPGVGMSMMVPQEAFEWSLAGPEADCMEPEYLRHYLRHVGEAI